MKKLFISLGVVVVAAGGWGGWQMIAEHDRERLKELQEMPMTSTCVDPILSELKGIAFRRNAEAAGFVGGCLMNGKGATGTIEEIEKWYQQGASGGDYHSQRGLEAIQGCRAAKQSVEGGDKTKFFELASCYDLGYGMVRDLVEARKCYLLAGDKTDQVNFFSGRDLTPAEEAEAQKRAAAWKPIR